MPRRTVWARCRHSPTNVLISWKSGNASYHSFIHLLIISSKDDRIVRDISCTEMQCFIWLCDKVILSHLSYCLMILRFSLNIYWTLAIRETNDPIGAFSYLISFCSYHGSRIWLLLLLSFFRCDAYIYLLQGTQAGNGRDAAHCQRHCVVWSEEVSWRWVAFELDLEGMEK